MTDLQALLVRPDGFGPKERYTTRDFAELEQTRLWSRVWQIACREEQVAEPGEFVEYTIGDEGVAIVRAETGALHAFYNTCLHRGRRLAEGCGSFADGAIRCPFHGWCYALDGRLVEVPDREEFVGLPDDLALSPVRVETWGGFVFVNLDPDAEPLLDYLDPLPLLLGPYHLEQMRLRASLSTIIDANWKAVVDAFNEGYHVQGLHRQILPWTDDVSIEYEQLGRHAHYGRLPGARRQLRPSPRLHLGPDDYDEGRVQPKFFENWRERSWGEITEQDYENLGNVQQGMRSKGWTGPRLNPRQEGNILHMHRVIDDYLTAEGAHG